MSPSMEGFLSPELALLFVFRGVEVAAPRLSAGVLFGVLSVAFVLWKFIRVKALMCSIDG